MTRRAARRACCEVSELLGLLADLVSEAPAALAPRREILLFLRRVIDRELEREPRRARAPKPRRAARAVAVRVARPRRSSNPRAPGR
ncbi:MAG: hypothetical protein U0166_27900 [Acidobacteriota bacterium]